MRNKAARNRQETINFEKKWSELEDSKNSEYNLYSVEFESVPRNVLFALEEALIKT